MATFETIRPRLPVSPEHCYSFISAYTAKRELDLIQPNIYVKQARAAKERVEKKIEKEKKISVSLAQLQMLQKLGLA
jgi:hypothetical protein